LDRRIIDRVPHTRQARAARGKRVSCSASAAAARDSLRTGNFSRFDREFAGASRAAAHRLQAGEIAPKPAAHFTQRLARPPGEAHPFAGRDLATADGGERFPERRGDLRRRMHAGKVDAEPLAGIGLARRRRQYEAQDRSHQVAPAPDERSQGAGARLTQQQSDRAASRVANAARPALPVSGMALREAAFGIPRRVPPSRPRARTRAGGIQSWLRERRETAQSRRG